MEQENKNQTMSPDTEQAWELREQSLAKRGGQGWCFTLRKYRAVNAALKLSEMSRALLAQTPGVTGLQ